MMKAKWIKDDTPVNEFFTWKKDHIYDIETVCTFRKSELKYADCTKIHAVPVIKAKLMYYGIENIYRDYLNVEDMLSEWEILESESVLIQLPLKEIN